MKKLFVIALAAFGMVACVNEEITELPQGGAITFESAFIDNATRAAVDPSITTASLAGFNVWGFVKEYDGTIFNAVDVKKVGGVWGYEGTQYWVPNQPYYFAALAPMDSANWSVEKATGDAAKLGLGTVDFTNVDGSEDLLYAKEMMQSKSTVAEENGPVKFQFQHLLSKVKFTFKNGFPTETASIKVTDVKMTAPKKANIDLAVADYSKGWGDYTDVVTLAFGDVEKLAYTQSAEVANERLTIPAADYTYTITFDVELFMGAQSVYTVEKTSIVKGHELAMGYAYNFTAEITPENLNLEAIEFEVEEVEDWDNASMGVYPGKTVGVATAAELSAALANPEVTAVVLTEDITLGSTTITRAEGESAVTITKKDFVIDGGGNTLTYEGSNRVIDVKAEDNVIKNVIIKNLNINCTSSYLERGINFNNAKGTLLVENVTFEGTAPTYALNFPAKANGAKATIKNSYLAGNIALNVWAENMQIDVINSELIGVDNSAAEGYAVVSLNNQGGNAANYSTVNVEGGEVKVIYEGEGETQPSCAFRDATIGSEFNISETTVVVGEIKIPVVNVIYEGYNQFYSFTTLQAAIDKVQADNNGTIQLFKDLVLTEKVNVANDDYAVVLDLNGYNLHMVDTTEAGFEMINNAGNLTIQGEGKLSVEATIDSGWNRRSAVVSNVPGGNLTVKEGVVIEHLGGTAMAYGIDNLTNGKGTYAVTTIKGATVKSTYSAIRQFLNGIEATNELYVKAGSVIYSPNRSIFFQDPSKNANTGKLVIEAGAEVTGDVRLSVTEGSTEWPVEVSVAASALTEGSEVTWNLVPAGYTVVLENGVYTVVEAAAVTTAEELAAAVANKLETIYVSGEIDLANVILSGYNGTIVGLDNTAVLNTRNFIPSADECYQLRCEAINFQNITVKVPTEDGDFLKTGFVGFGAIQFDNCVFEGQVTLNGQASWIFNECEFASIENGAYAVFVYGAKKATFNNCSFSGVDRAAKIYGTGGVLDVEYNNCTFTSTTANKYAVNIDATYATTTVALNGCSQTGMPGLYKVDGTKGTVSVN